MTLTLNILRCPPSVAPETRRVPGGAFAIGRGADNDWVLADPDKRLSRRHCVIAWRSGFWQVEDVSSNGTFVNRDDRPLGSGRSRALEDGDRLRIGDYEIEVQVEAETGGIYDRHGAAPPPFEGDPFGVEAPAEAHADDPLAGSAFGAASALLPSDYDALAPDDAHGPTVPDHAAAVADAVRTPRIVPHLPEGWDHFVPSASAPAPPAATPPVPAAAMPTPLKAATPAGETPPAEPPPRAGQDPIEAFIRGAGVEGVKPEDLTRMMERLGASFRALVAGIRLILIARAEAKREFRIEQTQIRTTGNNLLKFSANTDDALAGLLGAGRRTDMSAEEAIADALADIRYHECATITAMQAAVRALVARLSPESVQKSLEGAAGLALPGQRKARAWDAYAALHANIARGLSDDFDSVFGKSFALSYERAIQELAGRRSPDDRE